MGVLRGGYLSLTRWYAYIFYCGSEVGVGTPSPDEPGHKKTPEMNELETN